MLGIVLDTRTASSNNMGESTHVLYCWLPTFGAIIIFVLPVLLLMVLMLLLLHRICVKRYTT